jgi:hypothetical protein
MTGIYPDTKTPADNCPACFCFIGDLTYDTREFVLTLSLMEVLYGRYVS